MRYIAPDWVARQVAEHDSFTRLLMIEQPRGLYEITGITDFGDMVLHNGNQVHYLKLPHAPGVYDLCESWGYSNCSTRDLYCIKVGEIIYKSELSKEHAKHFNYLWTSPLTCPKSRYKIQLDVEVKRVQDIKITDMRIITGNALTVSNAYIDRILYDEFTDWFNANFATPRKQGDGYVSYPYDEPNPICSKHKGKPLTIHVNPFVVVEKARVI